MSGLEQGVLALAMAASVLAPAYAQEHAEHHAHAAHQAHAEEARHGSHRSQGSRDAHGAHEAHGNPPASPATPLPSLTDVDRAAAFPEVHGHMQHAPWFNTYLLFNRLEAWDTDHGGGQAWELEGWAGGDIHRLWLRSEGERSAGHTSAASLELLYGRAMTPWWDVVVGLRHDLAPGRSQDRLAVGVQGLAPWMFEVTVTGYVGGSARTMLGIEVEREVLLSNRLILQPMLEATFHGRDDAARGVGGGLSTVEAGLRLRYEASRRFAPYVGVVHGRAFGDTAAFRNASNAPARDSHVVIGARIWF